MAEPQAVSLADTHRAGHPPRSPALGDRAGQAGVAIAAVAFIVALAAGASPVGAAAIPLGGILGIALVRRPEVALLALVAAGPLEPAFQVPSDQFFTPVKALGLVAFATYGLAFLVSGRRIVFDRVHGVVALLLGVALVSTLGARSTGDALSTSFRYASFGGLYFVATQPGRRLVTQLAWVLSGASTAASVLAINSLATGARDLAVPGNGDPNDFAFTVATALPLAVWLLGNRGLQRLMAASFVAVMATALLLSLSRGALVGLAAGVVWHAAVRRRHLPAIAAASVIALAAALVVVSSNEATVERSVELKQGTAAHNVESRLDAWRAAADLAARHPVLGVGPGNFASRYYEETGAPVGTFALRVVHNTYLDVAAELGFTGLALFLAYLALTFGRATAAARLGRGPSGLAEAVRTAMVVAIVAGMFLSEQYFPSFWVLGAMATLLWREDTAEPR